MHFLCVIHHKRIGTQNNICTPIGAIQHHIWIWILKQTKPSTFACSWSMCTCYAYLFNRSTCAISFKIINSKCAAKQHFDSGAPCHPSQALALRIYMSKSWPHANASFKWIWPPDVVPWAFVSSTWYFVPKNSYFWQYSKVLWVSGHSGWIQRNQTHRVKG